VVSVTLVDASAINGMQATAKQAVYIIANALNATILDCQKAEFANFRSRFMVRKPDFFFGTKARPGGAVGKVRRASAKKEVMQASVRTADFSGTTGKRRVIVAGMETGQFKTPNAGAKNVAVPLTGTPSRPSFSQSVPADFTITGLTFRKPGSRSKKSTGRFALRGRQRTFLIPNVGVFQRTGAGSDRALYLFKRRVKLPAKLHFVSTAQSIAQEKFPRYVRDGLTEAMLHNMKKGVRSGMDAVGIAAALFGGVARVAAGGGSDGESDSY
jgi:hypothetical protein